MPTAAVSSEESPPVSPRSVIGTLVVYLVASAALAVVLLPVAAEQAAERVWVDERLGTLPVRVSLTHDGTSTLATGLLGDVYFEATGAYGFGVHARTHVHHRHAAPPSVTRVTLVSKPH